MPKWHYLLEKKKCVNICLGAYLIFHPPPPNPIIFTRIEPLVFKFSISMFYTSILQGTTLSLPCHQSLCYKYVNIVKVEISWVIHLKLKELSKLLSVFYPSHSFTLSLSYIFFFFKILVQNLFGIKNLRVFLILLEGVPIFFVKVNK